MSGKNRKFVIVVALGAALVMLLTLSSASLAGGETTATTCVDGYVINHRELAVDGIKAVLTIDAIGSSSELAAPVGADGYFKFKDIPVGDWNFVLQLPEGWEGIVPEAERAGLAETGYTTIGERKGCHRIVFKIRRVVEVIVNKWEEGLDGMVRPGVGWTITATPVKDPFVKAQTDKTDENGMTGFTLTAGKWIISETLKVGWKPITPQQVTIELDQYGPVGARDPVVFKNLEPPCYGEIVVEKAGFGTSEKLGEVLLGPLAGWKVTVSRADGTMPPITMVTDGTGRATFANLRPGVYMVKEHLQPGWEALDPNPQTVVHMNCESTVVRFSNKETKGTLKIYGKKLFRAWTAPYKGELVGLSGWKITAKLVGTDLETTTVTNALGEYVFTAEQLKDAGMGFPGASIDVCEENRDNWIHVTPKCVRVRFPYPVPADYAGVKVDFTNIQDPPVVSGGTVSGSSDYCQASYTVVRGDTLAKIATRYATSVTALARANKIANADLIYLGQTLCIP